MKTLNIIILLFIVLTINTVKAQTITLNTGMYSYSGDLEKANTIKGGTRWQFGYGLFLGKTFNNGFEIKLGFNKYNLSQNEVKIDSNLNFQTKVFEISGAFLYHLDNDIIINKTSKISPYIGVGIGTALYETFYDYLDEKGNNYYYWNDGSVRNQEENYNNIFTSEKIKRDYNYETSANNKSNTLIVPLIFGVELKTGNKINIGLEGKYYITQTDLIDNYETGSNDSYFYLGASLKYNILSKTINHHNNKNYKGIKFSEIDKMDQDKDGIIDTKDLCQDTKKGVEVDEKGCPFDLDNDFVFDYKDQELNTSDSSAVTPEGITITDEHFQIMLMLYYGQIFPVEEFFFKNFQYIPELLREEMARFVKVDKSNSTYQTSSEEIKKMLNKVTIIGTGGEKKIINSSVEE